MAGSPVDSGKDLAETALIETSAAACVVPVAWAVAGELYMLQSDPGQLYAAGEAWLRYAGMLKDALDANEELTNSVGASGWSGSDHDAFTARAADLSRQLMGAWALALAVGVALIAMAVALFAVIVVTVVIGTALDAFAAAILAAIASIVGNLGASESLMLEAEVFALDCETSLKGAAGMLDGLAAGLAATVTALLAGDVGWQLANGDTDALGDLGQATVDGLGTVATGLVAMLYQRGVGKYMKTPYDLPLVRAIGLTDTITGSTVVDRTTKDLDPSR